ncbi:PQQ-dependent sugar dehydrogenase, partial [Salmonella enterica subsp. enterica serovar Kentucky]|nr:PQQ-dependent sugar dehydrogenase [Salmonella enterica subsp. enterica serovar Kentucky]
NLAPVNVEVLQTRLDHPWSLAFLPDNRGMLITLKGGQLRHWQPGIVLFIGAKGVNTLPMMVYSKAILESDYTVACMIALINIVLS